MMSDGVVIALIVVAPFALVLAVLIALVAP